MTPSLKEQDAEQRQSFELVKGLLSTAVCVRGLECNMKPALFEARTDWKVDPARHLDVLAVDNHPP